MHWYNTAFYSVLMKSNSFYAPLFLNVYTIVHSLLLLQIRNVLAHPFCSYHPLLLNTIELSSALYRLLHSLHVWSGLRTACIARDFPITINPVISFSLIKFPSFLLSRFIPRHKSSQVAYMTVWNVGSLNGGTGVKIMMVWNTGVEMMVCNAEVLNHSMKHSR